LVHDATPLTVETLRLLGSETVTVTYEAGDTVVTHTFTGVHVRDVLDAVGLVIDPAVHNPLLQLFVIVTAKDGYQVVLAGGELDRCAGTAPLLLAWEEDGQPLSADQGSVRLVVPGDRGGRYLWGVVRIEVRSIAEPGG
jgi:hypothetical protein